MLKKQVVLAIVFLSGLINFLILTPSVSSTGPDERGCYSFTDKYICPDKYCSGEISCNNDGSECFCKSKLINKGDNKDCEIAFGSNLHYRFEDNKPEIYLNGGIWDAIINHQKITSSNEHIKVIDGKKYIVFRQNNNGSYSSGILTNLANDYNPGHGNDSGMHLNNFQQINIVLDADVDSKSSVAKIINQRFEVIDKQGQATSCAQYSFGSEQFYLKFSPNESGKAPDNGNFIVPNSGPCTMPADILSNIVTKNKKYSKNCKKDDSLRPLMNGLIVPHGESRNVYFKRPDNFICGQVFNGINTAKKIKKVREYYNTNCKGKSNPPSNCEECNSKIIDKLEKSPENTTLNDILINNLLSEKDDMCDTINESASSILGTTALNNANMLLNPLQTIKDIFTNPIVRNKTEEEKTIDKQLPNGLLRLCESPNRKLSDADRLKCKRNALECYQKSKPEREDSTMCENLTGSLQSSRWVICPVSNTISAGADRATELINKLFSFSDLSFFKNPTFKSAWSLFRNLSNIFLVIIVLFILISQITDMGLSNYNIKKMLPKLIVAIILINFSFIIAQLAVDLSNIIGSGMFKLLGQLTEPLKRSAPPVSISTLAFGILSLTGVLAILGGLILLFPLVIVLIVGLFFILLMISLRHALLIMFILLMPIAILSNVVPRIDNFFQVWYRNFMNVLLVYPIIAILYGSGNFLKYLLISTASSSDNLLKVIGFAMPFVTTLATPFVLFTITKGISSLNSLTRNSFNRATQTAWKTSYNSTFNSNIGNFQTNFYDKLQHSKTMTGLYHSKAFNRVFSGAGNTMLNQQASRDFARQSDYKNIIGDDLELLRTFHQNDGRMSGQNYASLTDSQKQTYQKLANLGANKDKVFQLASLQAIAANGGGDTELINHIIGNLSHSGISEKEITNIAQNNARAAAKKGHVLTASLFNYLAKNQQETTINRAELIDEIDKILNKVRPGDFKSDNFRTPLNANDPQNNFQPALIQAIDRRLSQDFIVKDNKINIDSHYLGRIGQEYYNMPAEIQKILSPHIINAVNRYNTTLNQPISQHLSAEDALKSIGAIK